MTECDDLPYCGSPDERHWVECDPPEQSEDRECSENYSEDEEEYASEYEDYYCEERNTFYDEDEPDDDPTDESNCDY